MSIFGALGTFYVFSLQEKQAFSNYKKEVQLSKQLEITDMQDRIQKYSELHMQFGIFLNPILHISDFELF